jgi:hypothetical protein
MKRVLFCAMLALGGCQSTVTELEQTTVLAGDYQILSECFYREVAQTPGYRKTDSPSTRTNTILGSSKGEPADRIDFIGTGEGITRVQAQLGAAGTAWTRYLSVLKQCEQPSG